MHDPTCKKQCSIKTKLALKQNKLESAKEDNNKRQGNEEDTCKRLEPGTELDCTRFQRRNLQT